MAAQTMALAPSSTGRGAFEPPMSVWTHPGFTELTRMPPPRRSDARMRVGAVGGARPVLARASEDSGPAEVVGGDGRRGVEGGLGGAVAGGSTAHVFEGRQPGRDV